MNLRNTLSIMPLLVCHCVLGGSLFAREVPVPQSGMNTVDSRTQKVTLRAQQQEKAGNMYHLRGEVEVATDQYTLHADEIDYNADSGEVVASGHVELSGGAEDLLIQATRAEYNLTTQNGKFYDVLGTAGMKYRGGPRAVLTTTNPFTFRGKLVEKLGKRHYLLHDGMVTSCMLPNPKWSFHSGRVDFTLGGTAKIYHSTFRLRDIPVLYLPFAEHPAEQEGRQTGFLVPSIGVSSRKGLILGDAVYWAISRSVDTTVGAEYFSQRGWAQHVNFRARPSDDSAIELTYFGVLDKGLKTFNPATGTNFLQDQGGEDVKLTATAATLPWGFYGAVSAEYLNRYLFRLAFTENFSQAVNSEVKSVAFASKPFAGYEFSMFLRRYQNFQSTNPGDVITILHAPSLQFSSVDRSVLGPLKFGFDTAAEGLSRSEPGLRTANTVARLDIAPYLVAPVFAHGWTLAPEFSVRNTSYTQQLRAVNGIDTPVNDPLNRRSLEMDFELRPPTLVRIFDKPVFGRKVKHTVEAAIHYRFVNGIQNFPNILRFDYRDLANDTNEIEYSLMNRIYTRKLKQPACTEEEKALKEAAGDRSCSQGVREMLSWEIAQKYFFDQKFGGAVVPGVSNVLVSSEDLTGIAFITQPRDFSPIISRLRLQSTTRSQLEWSLDYDSKRGGINSSNVLFDYHLGPSFFGVSHTYLLTPGDIVTQTGALLPQQRFNQFRVLAGYGNPDRRGISAAANVGVDVQFKNFQYSAVQTAYNWDCCGVNFEYRRFGLGTVRNENQYRFAFTLANIGSFGNLKRQEQLF